MISLKIRHAVALAVALSGASVEATVVANSLPYPGSPDWTTVVFNGSSMGLNAAGTETTLTTGSGGVWFGAGIGGNAPNWSLGSSSDGNQVALTARFSTGGRDWNTYLADGLSIASIQYGPTNCDGNAMACYNAPFLSGISLSFAAAFNSNVAADRFIDLDLTQDNDFGFLMKDGLVSYFINGNAYSGFAQSAGYRILVIGDGSGSTQTGSGSMIVSAVSFDNAPTANVVLGGVPEPATWATMLGGFALIGASARRGRPMVARNRLG